MDRRITNRIRYFMDEWLPPVIRDAKWFMYPIFWYWFKGKNIKTYMEFKSIVKDLSDDEFNNIYANIDSLAYDRPTDCSQISIDKMIASFRKDAKTLLDVGCGRGYVLNQMVKTGLTLNGLDVKDNVPLENGTYHKGTITKMPFADKQFDIVVSTHTIEHLVDLNSAISELKRVCAKQLIIICPKQRYYYYTLDLHLNFFPEEYYLQNAIGLKNYTCVEIEGDWLYIGQLD